MISEARPRYSTVEVDPCRLIFSFLRIGQLGWVVLGVPAKTSIRPSGAPRIFRGEKIFQKRNTFAAEFLAFFTENRGFHATFRQNYLTSFLFANILSNKSI